MKRPFKYFILCDKTKNLVTQTNQVPLLSDLQTYEPTQDPKTYELKQTKTAYIDTRYTAKIRLYNYLNNKKFRKLN
jgi:hypothetical protein